MNFPPFLSDLCDDARDDVDGAEVDLQPLLDVLGDRRLGAPRAAVTVVVQSEKMINMKFGFSKNPDDN